MQKQKEIESLNELISKLKQTPSKIKNNNKAMQKEQKY